MSVLRLLKAIIATLYMIDFIYYRYVQMDQEIRPCKIDILIDFNACLR